MFESQEDDGLGVLQNSILPDSIPQIENVGNDSLKRLDRYKYVKSMSTVMLTRWNVLKNRIGKPILFYNNYI